MMRSYSVTRGTLYASFFAWPAMIWVMFFVFIPSLRGPEAQAAEILSGIFVVLELALAVALGVPTRRELLAGGITTVVNATLAGVVFGFIDPPPAYAALALVVVLCVVVSQFVFAMVHRHQQKTTAPTPAGVKPQKINWLAD